VTCYGEFANSGGHSERGEGWDQIQLVSAEACWRDSNFLPLIRTGGRPKNNMHPLVDCRVEPHSTATCKGMNLRLRVCPRSQHFAEYLLVRDICSDRHDHP
jgi:hypothetical protein